MKKTIILSSLALTPFCSTFAQVVLTERASGDFSSALSQYEGDALPSASGYAAGFGPESSFASTSGGILNFDTTDGSESTNSNRLIYTRNGFAIDQSVGYTFEVRARVNAIEPITAPASSQGFRVFAIGPDAGGGSISEIVIQDDQLVVRDGNDGFVAFAHDFTDDFHTVRVAKLANSTDFQVYLDDTIIGTTFTLLSGGTAAGRLRFGNDVTSAEINVDLDYIRFDNTGAFAPAIIPEPTSYAILFSAVTVFFGIYLRRKKAHAKHT